MIKLVIFDFDGTVVDSKEVYYHSIRNHLYNFGFGKEAIDKTIDLGLNLGETLRRFVPSRITRWFVRREIMHDVLQEASRVKKCHDAGHIQDIQTRKILVSNSLSEFVLPVLRHLKLRNAFNEIYCADDFNDKIIFISKYLKNRKIKPKECFYIGDRVADIKVAKKVGCHSAVISGRCSWNSKEELIKAKPDFIVPDLILLKRIVEKFRD